MLSRSMVASSILLMPSVVNIFIISILIVRKKGVKKQLQKYGFFLGYDRETQKNSLITEFFAKTHDIGV